MADHPPFRRRLLVEGAKDRRIIPFLMEANGVVWPNDKAKAPVVIDDQEGSSRLLAFLESDEFDIQIKEPSLQAIGVVLDADTDANAVWRSVKNRVSAFINDLPEQFPPTGLIAQTVEGVRFGVWIMPDNRSEGMMETFLRFLLPAEGMSLWTLAQECARRAKVQGARYRQVHADKANIHTWLAWQDPPGSQLHEAIRDRVLDPQSPHAVAFVTWFRNLFQV